MVHTQTQIKSKKVTFGKSNEVKGWFKLSDGTKTNFTISKHGEWEQWGNTRDNLGVSVPFIEELINFLTIEE
jgi:hypothetical protein